MNETHKRWQRMDQLTTEANHTEARLLRLEREARSGLYIDAPSPRRLSRLAYRAFLRTQRRRAKADAIAQGR